MTFDEALKLAHAIAARYETRLGQCIFRDPLGEPPGRIWLLCFDIIDGPPDWCWMLSVGPGEPDGLQATTARPPAETFPYAQFGMSVPEALHGAMSDSQKSRWAQFSLRQLVVCITWYGIYAAILTSLHLADRRLFLTLLLGTPALLVIPGSVVLFAPKQRRWLMPIAIVLVSVVGGFIGLWLAQIHNHELKSRKQAIPANPISD